MTQEPNEHLTVVIWGAGGHAEVVTEAACQAGLPVHGYVDDTEPHRWGTMLRGAPILGGTEQLPALCKLPGCRLIIAIGDCAARLRLAARATEAGAAFATVIHPRASVASDARIGPGSIVGAGAVVNIGAHLGAHVIVNSGAVVEHHCWVDDGVHVAPNATLAGRVSVGQGAFVGAGASVRDGCSVGKWSVIGAGAVVVRNVPDRVLAYGVPARVHREL